MEDNKILDPRKERKKYKVLKMNENKKTNTSNIKIKVKPSFKNTIKAAEYRSRLFQHIKSKLPIIAPKEAEKDLEKLTTILGARKYDQAASQTVKFRILSGFNLTAEEAKLLEHPITKFAEWIVN